MAVCILPDGFKLAYQIEPCGSGAPWIVFGNSLMTDFSIWDDQVAALAGRFNVLRYDQRGHGASDVPGGPVEIPLLGQDLVAVITDAGIGRCTYAGLSMGVPTGLAAFSIRPSLFERMILVDGQARSAATGRAFWEERIAFAREHGMDALADQTVNRWLRPNSPKAGRLRSMIGATPLDGFIACASALRDYDQSPVLPQLNIPVHLIAGAEDGAMPATMEALTALIADATFTSVREAGHIPNFERPDAFNALLMQTLEARS